MYNTWGPLYKRAITKYSDKIINVIRMIILNINLLRLITRYCEWKKQHYKRHNIGHLRDFKVYNVFLKYSK